MNYKLINQDKNRAIIGEPVFVYDDEHNGKGFEQACVEMIRLLQASALDETVEISSDNGPFLRLKVDFKASHAG